MSRSGQQRDRRKKFKVESSVGYTRYAKKVFVIMIMSAQYFMNSWYLSDNKHIIGSALPYHSRLNIIKQYPVVFLYCFETSL
jgi:hypothetical protein